MIRSAVASKIIDAKIVGHKEYDVGRTRRLRVGQRNGKTIQSR
jgi:hypothetical protein